MSIDLIFYLLNKYDLIRFADQLKKFLAQNNKPSITLRLYICHLGAKLNNKNHFVQHM